MTRTSKPNKKRKVEIVFDPEKRKEFLTGFRKRKNERRKRAKEELERNIKEERKRIRLEIKDGIKHMKKSYEPLRELTEQDKTNEDEYEDDDVKVKIVELTTSDLAAQRNFLGDNQGAETDESAAASADEAASVNEQNVNCIPGMDFAVRKRKANNKTNDDETYSDPTNKKNPNTTLIKSKKDLDRLKKNKTLKQLKKSKVFKMKERFEKKANQKKAQRDKNNTLKSIPKNQRKKKKLEASRYLKGRLVNKKQLRRKQQRD